MRRIIKTRALGSLLASVVKDEQDRAALRAAIINALTGKSGIEIEAPRRRRRAVCPRHGRCGCTPDDCPTSPGRED